MSNNLIISSSNLPSHLVRALISSNFSLILPSTKVSRIDLDNEINDEYSDEHRCSILYSPAINSSNQSIHELSKLLDNLCNVWSTSSSQLLLILDSEITSIFTFNFAKTCSYILLFRNGTNDYSFEYIEYIINRLNKQGFLIKSLISIKNSKGLESVLKSKKDILLFACCNFKDNISNIEVNQKAIGKLLLSELSKN